MRPTDLESILTTWLARQPSMHDPIPYVVGAPGIGKSTILAAIADRLGLALVDRRPAQYQESDWCGWPERTLQDGHAVMSFTAPEFLPLAGRDLPPGILFLDEADKAPPGIQNILLQLLYDRRIGQHVIHPDWRIAMAGNRPQDQAGSQRWHSAINRRVWRLTLETSADDWLAWASANGINPIVLAFIRRYPDRLLAATPDGLECPRSWHYVSTLLGVYPEPTSELIEGVVGVQSGLDFCTFLRFRNELPEWPEIIADPATAKLPTADGLLYASAIVCARGATGNGASETDLDCAVRYATRLPAEFAAMVVRDIAIRRPEIFKSKSIGAWQQLVA